MIVTTFTILFVTFMMHVLWWRIKMPKNATAMLVRLFMSMAIMTSVFFYGLNVETFKSLPQVVQYLMLYCSCALAYIIVYSAVEQQSPSLAIVMYISRFTGCDCSSKSLSNHLKFDDAITRRISLIENSGWIYEKSGRWYLTQRGKWMALLFNSGAVVFGLGVGG